MNSLCTQLDLRATIPTMPTMSTEVTLMSVREAAGRIGVHDNTIRRYADRGMIRAVRLPSGVRRLRRDDVEALAARMASGALDATARAGPAEEDGVAELAPVDEPASPRALEELFAPEIWKSDEEVEEFLALTYAERDGDR